MDRVERHIGVSNKMETPSGRSSRNIISRLVLEETSVDGGWNRAGVIPMDRGRTPNETLLEPS
jgi:hypothetical protein